MILETELPLSTAAAFLGVKPRTLQSWVQYMPTEQVEGGGSKGSHRRFSFYAVMQTATAVRLILMGVTASRAFEIAEEFVIGGGDEKATWGDEVSATREPALPYPLPVGDTYLCADATRACVVRVPKGGNFDAAIKATDINAAELIRIDMWPIYQGVVAGLTDNSNAPFDLMYEVYGDIIAGA